MELFGDRSNILFSLEECAEWVVSTVPEAMSMVRKDMRARRPAELSIPQFRTLIYLLRDPGASISMVAEHLGLVLSTTSQLIEVLVQRDYITRDVAVRDRRCSTVALTEHGKAVLEAIYANARARMTERLATLSPEECRIVGAAMQILHRVAGAGETPKRKLS